MKILLVSETCSPGKYDVISKQRRLVLLGPQQRFFHLLIKGLILHEGTSVECLSATPVSAKSHPKKFWFFEQENPNPNLRYTYLGFINGKFLRFISLYISTFRYCIKWLRANKHETQKVIICDPLIAHCAAAAVRAARLNNCKVIAIVTDIPQYVTSIGIATSSRFRKLLQHRYDSFSFKEMQKYDAYILLTMQMNELINVARKPFLIIEGSVDSDMKDINNRIEDKDKPLTVLYAGGIHEKFGVSKLARAFTKLSISDVVLKIFGAGEHVSEIEDIAKEDDRIRYMGAVPVDEVIIHEVRATLLVNPRPTDEDFTKFSFPSKTTEYMVSGTPVLSTRLPGIPNEYSDYIYWFDGEEEVEMKETFEKLLNSDPKVLHSFGERARDFVLTHKSNINQAKKIVGFIQNVL